MAALIWDEVNVGNVIHWEVPNYDGVDVSSYLVLSRVPTSRDAITFKLLCLDNGNVFYDNYRQRWRLLPHNIVRVDRASEAS